jgi:hypothetical protein
VLSAGKAIGFDPVDAGPLTNARWMETLGYFNIQLGYTLNKGTDIGFRLVHYNYRKGSGEAGEDAVWTTILNFPRSPAQN